MLLNTTIKVEVTNDGNNNKVSVNTDLNLKLQDVLTSLGLAQNNYKDLFIIYIQSKYGKLPKKQIDKIYSAITLKELFDYSQKKAIETIKTK
jgi:hypothetical protein